MMQTPVLAELVPLIDPERSIDRSFEHMSDCTQILLDEGWTWQQVGNWARLAFQLQPRFLRLRLGRRRN